jgi:hypothetical protein
LLITPQKEEKGVVYVKMEKLIAVNAVMALCTHKV